MRLLSWLAAAAFGAGIAQSANVTHSWTVSWVDDVDPVGVGPRRAIGMNGKWPPPIVNVNSDDFVSINVTNGFDDGRGTTLHAHGMYFNRTNYMDGAAMVTQCAIPAGSSFMYHPLNSPESPPDRQEQWGTYWMHGHYDGQTLDGFRLPNIIHNAHGEVHEYDEDYTIMLSDWYLGFYDDLVKNEFMNDVNPTGAEPVPESAMLYIAHTPQNGTAEYLPNFNENTSIPFEPGKRYRLRIINSGVLSMFHFWIEGHDMEIIEADGCDTVPFPIDVLPISVAQRYSVLVTARNDTNNNWLVHANMDPDMFDQIPDDLELNITSTITYAPDAPLGKGIGEVDYDPLDDTKLEPVQKMAMLSADVTQDLNVDFDTYSDGINYASFNNVSFVMPITPTILTAKTEPKLAMDPKVYGPSTSALVTEHLQTVQIRIHNWDDGYHPFHLHGTQFQLIHKSFDVTSDDPQENPPFPKDVPNPMRRDTVMVPPIGSATIRFVSDNPGAWFFHCHIDWHMEAGLAMIVLEAPNMLDDTVVPDYVFEHCRAMGLGASGNAGGVANSTSDFGALWAGPTYLVSGWTPKMIGTFVINIITHGLARRDAARQFAPVPSPNRRRQVPALRQIR
ncbi:hypothetical protein MSPP1_003048 [Malassezia sp. CBS 17886]|nr:hypothetical protein MSPP1_003048 [Malassezia sp. CBS 17886]